MNPYPLYKIQYCLGDKESIVLFVQLTPTNHPQTVIIPKHMLRDLAADLLKQLKPTQD